MKRVLKSIVAMSLCIFSMHGVFGQSTVSTGLVPNNQLSAVTYELSSIQPIFVTGMSTVFNASAGTSGPVEIWYRIGGVLAPGQTVPVVNAANGWVLGLSTTAVSAGNLTPAAIPFGSTMLVFPANTQIGIAINGTGSLGMRYRSWTTGTATSFDDGTLTIHVMPNGFGMTTNMGGNPIASRVLCGSVTYIPQQACSGVPTAGTSVSSLAQVCPLQNFNVSLSGATLASGLGYQWQSAQSASGPWSNIPSATSSSATLSQTSDTWYRCEVTCLASSSSSYSSPVQVLTSLNLASGTYTIGAGGNYSSFSAAFAAASCGVAGPVVFQVIPNSGPYNEQLEIPELPGMSSVNTIIVKGNGNTLINATSASSGISHTLFLNGADYLRFEDLTIEATGVTNGCAVRMYNNSDNVTFKRCILKSSEFSTTTSVTTLTLSATATSNTSTGSSSASNLLIDSCQIIGGYYGAWLNGTGVANGPDAANNTIRNSTFSNFYYSGIRSTGQSNLVIENNEFNRATRATVSTTYTLYLSGRSPGLKVLRNRIHTLSGASGTSNYSGYGVWLSSVSGSMANRALVANNAVYNIKNGTSGFSGIYSSTSDTLDVYHNTVVLDSSSNKGTSTVYGAYFSGNLNSVDFKNNLISIGSSGTGAKYCLYNASTTNVINSDYNGLNLDNPGGTTNFVAARSTSLRYTTVSDWTAVTGLDSNSLMSNPLFGSVGDVTPGAWGYNNTGTSLFTVVPKDINGTSRSSTTPDIGAVEYTPVGCPTPFGVSVSSVRANSASVSFTSLAPSVELQWGPKGFTPIAGQGSLTTSGSFTLSGLTSYQDYDLYLSGNCGSGQSSPWVGPYSFTTPVQVGWVEGFSAGYDPLSATAPKPNLWTELNGPAANPTVVATNTSSWMQSGWLNSGSVGGIKNAIPIASSTTQGWTVTPTIDLGDVSHTTYFEWNMGMTNSGGTNSGVMGLDDTLMVVISTDAGATWNRSQALKKYHRSSGISPFGGRYSVDLSSYTGLVKLGFYLESLTSSAGHLNASSVDVHIDSVGLVQTQSACLAPEVIVTSTPTSAIVSWSPMTTGGLLAWGPLGFNLGTGATGGTQMQANASPDTITGLTQGTTYQIYYQAPCGAATGQWVGPYTIVTPCVSSLNGAYTIDSNGTGANNFNSLADAVSILSACGVSGPVTFTLAGYEHIGGLSLAAIPGVSATNRVIFQGDASGNASIKGLTSQPGAVMLNGSQFITIQNLLINAPTMSGVILTGGAEHITIQNNRIYSDTTSTSATTAGVLSTSSLTSVSGYGNNANHISVLNNMFYGGYYGVRFNGTSTTVHCEDFVVNGNTFRKQHYYGVYLYYVDKLVLLDNDMRNYRNTTSVGIYAYYTNEAVIERNSHFGSSNGLNMGYHNTQYKPTIASRVANNMFKATSGYGVSFTYARYMDVYHNTFVGSSYGAYLVTSTGANLAKVLDLRNNIFVGGTYAFYFSGSTMDSITLDYNIYNSGGTGLAYYTAARATLTAWQTANPLLNANSSTNTVNFIGSDDLHVFFTGANNIGTPIPVITIDIDGDSRSTTVPDIGADEYTPLANDMEMMQVLNPKNMSCGDSNTVATVIVRNIGTAPQVNFTVGVNVSGPQPASISTLYSDTLYPLQVDTINVGVFNSVVGGALNIAGYVQLSNDGNTLNDTIVVSRAINDVLQWVPTASSDTLCVGEFATLYFPSGTNNQSFQWLTTAGDTIGTSDSLVVGPIGTTDTTFVLRQTSLESQVGPLDNTIGSTLNYTSMNHYLLFTVNTTATIYSVDVFAQNAGLVDVVIQDATTLANIQTVTVAATAPGLNTLVINVSLPPGTYRMGGTTVNNAGGLQRNSTGASYPYVSQDGSVTITGNTFNATYYYFFYNWKIGGNGCPHPDGIVTVHSQPNVTASFTSIPQSPNVSNLVVDFDATSSSNTTTSTTYDWNFGDGSTGSGATASHTYLANGTYNVSLIVTGECGSDTIVVPITIAGISVSELPLDRSLNVYPNPTSGVVRIDFELEVPQQVEIQVVNTIGQVVLKRTLNSSLGVQMEHLDLSSCAAGIYHLQVNTDEGVVTRRVAVQK